MTTCTRHTEFAKQSTVALALWVSILRFNTPMQNSAMFSAVKMTIFRFTLKRGVASRTAAKNNKYELIYFSIEQSDIAPIHDLTIGLFS